MKNILQIAIAFCALGAATASADSVTPAQILDRHVAAMKQGNLEAVMADYADNAVAITPHGIAPGQKPASSSDVFAGKQNVRTLFATLTDKDHVGGSRSMQTRYEARGNDVTLMYWVQFKGTSKQVSGVDIFVIQNEKIVFQDVTIDAAKP